MQRYHLTPEQQQLVLDNMGIAYMLVNRLWHIPLVKKSGEKSDLEQEALLALCRCAATPSFDPTKSKFCTYAGRAVRQSILDYAVKKALIPVPPCALKIPHLEGDAKKVRRIGQFVDRWDTPCPEEDPILAGDIESCLRRLDSRSARMIRERYWEGRKMSDIGEEEGVSRERVRQIIKNGQEELRSSLKEMV